MIGGKLSYGPAAKENLLEVMRMLVVVLVVNAGVPFPENKGKPQKQRSREREGRRRRTTNDMTIRRCCNAMSTGYRVILM